MQSPRHNDILSVILVMHSESFI